ncbi:MAG: hypothetical protein LIO94_03535, partial [Clostridiales bacterium]|nr:hypothetical protein [Clostridiales bacterium]
MGYFYNRRNSGKKQEQRKDRPFYGEAFMCAEEMEGAKEDTAMHRKMTQREMPPEKAEREELTLREMPQDKAERQETAQREMPLEKTAQKEMPSEKVEREELTQKEMPPKTAMCRRNMGANTFWDFFDLEDEAQTERDFRMLQSMYPKEAKELLAGVEEICDQMEYSGSSMYDEYPDYTTIYT